MEQTDQGEAQRTRQERDEARALVEELVREMEQWGAQGDGVPEECAAYDRAKALTRGGW